MMRAAILYEDDKVLVEFTPEKFKLLLMEYFQKTKKVDLALEELIKALKKEVLTK